MIELCNPQKNSQNIYVRIQITLLNLKRNCIKCLNWKNNFSNTIKYKEVASLFTLLDHRRLLN